MITAASHSGKAEMNEALVSGEMTSSTSKKGALRLLMYGTYTHSIGTTVWEMQSLNMTFYVAVYTLPFFLTNLNFLYRYWTIKSPQRLLLFSSKPFQAALIAAILSGSLTWYFVLYFFSGGDVNEPATILLRNYYMEKFNMPINDGWIVLDYWPNGTLSLRPLFVLLLTDALLLVSFLAAITLSSLTFYHIHTSTIVSEQARKAQRTVLIALCVQTVVPMLCVYVPYINNLNAPFFDVDDVISPETSASFISAFPLCDAAVIILLMRDDRQGARRLVCGAAGKKGMVVNSKVFTSTVAPTALKQYGPKTV
ncbi:hypothetical protein PRIPAC_78604 [Pristionchus pacificus]|uniref:G protein-coupled receptor n=1 Tax=Pristionchus pacificus TaxID=54126 RepID=A0A2A6CL22_PRIPA|nr:hypothetical protein PRIPAC_78604 [Pristionchus pacificus]|eukprot:PDM78819.1 G protein-coupled receptor [Pristionchus pacificus]